MKPWRPPIVAIPHSNGAINCACYSPDGKFIVSASTDTTVRLWDVATGEQLEGSTLIGHHAAVNSVSYSPNGESNRIVSGSADLTVSVWDAATGLQLATMEGHTAPVNSVCFSPDGNHIASGSADGTVRVWDAATGRLVSSTEGQGKFQVRSVCYSPDGRHIASGCSDELIRVWNAHTSEQMKALAGHSNAVNCVIYSPDGAHIASAGDDNTVRVWDAETGDEVMSMESHTGSVTTVCYSPDGQQLASCGDDETVRIWDLDDGEESACLAGHAGAVNSVCFSPDGTHIVSGGADHSVRMWHVESEAQQYVMGDEDSSALRFVIFSPNGCRIAGAGGVDNSVIVWDAKSGAICVALTGHSSAVMCVGFSPDGSRIVSGSEDKTVRVWDAATGEKIHLMDDSSGTVNGVCFSPDGAHIASAGDDNTVRVWDAETGDEVMSMESHTGSVTTVCYSPDGRHILSGSADTTMRLWDATTGAEMLLIEGHNEGIGFAVFSPDGKHIASAGWDWTVRVWDAVSGQQRVLMNGHTDEVACVSYSPDGNHIVSCDSNTTRVWDAGTGCEVLAVECGFDFHHVCYSPDGRHIASGSADGFVRLWDSATGALALSMDSGASDTMLWGACFSPDGRRIATCSTDETVRLWDAVTGSHIAAMQGHRSAVYGVSFCPDGQRVASCSGDGTVRVWDTTRGEELLQMDHATPVFAVCFSPDGRNIASGQQSGNALRVWNAATGRLVFATVDEDLDCPVYCVCYSPDGHRIAGACSDHSVRVWNAHNGKRLRYITGHTDEVMCVAFSNDGRRIVSGGLDGSIRLWNAANGVQNCLINGHTKPVMNVCFSPDGRHIASCGDDGSVRVWNAKTGQQQLIMAQSNRSIAALGYSPDGKRLISGWDQHARLWNAADGSVIRSAHHIAATFRVTSVSYSADQRFVACCSDSDCSVRVWDTSKGALVHTMVGHTGLAYGVRFSPDGRQMVSGGGDRSVRLWDVTTGKQLMVATFKRPVRSLCYSRDGRHVSYATATEVGVLRAFDLFVIAVTSTTRFSVNDRWSVRCSSWPTPTVADFIVSNSRFENEAFTLTVPEPSADPASFFGFVAMVSKLRQCLDDLYRDRAAWSSLRDPGTRPSARFDNINAAMATCAAARDALAATKASLRRSRHEGEHLTASADRFQECLDAVRRLGAGSHLRERDDVRSRASALVDSTTPSRAQPDDDAAPHVLEGDDDDTVSSPDAAPWYDAGLKIIDDLIRDVKASTEQLRSTVMEAVDLLNEPAAHLVGSAQSTASTTQRTKPQQASLDERVVAVAVALRLAETNSQRVAAVDAIIEVASEAPMRREAEDLRRRAEEAERADAACKAIMERHKAQKDALIREAVVPWTKVGSTGDAAAVVRELATLTDDVFDCDNALSISRKKLEQRAVQRDATKKAAAEAELADAEATAVAARTAFAALYRSKGRYVLSHYPEHREQMLALLPEALRAPTCSAGQSVYDPSVKLSDFDFNGKDNHSSSTNVRRAWPRDDSYFSNGTAGTHVAIKEFKDAHALVREVSVLKQAEQDGIANVARVLCAFEDTPDNNNHATTSDGSTRYYMAMPWYEGGPVYEWAARGDVDRHQLLSVAVEIARALARLHERGTMHVDLKPHNVVIDINTTTGGKPRYHARLIDFGSSLVVSGDAAMLATTLTRPMTATPAYIAPELFKAFMGGGADERTLRRRIADIDLARLDVYGVGTILKAMRLCDDDVLQRPPLPSAGATSDISDAVQRMLHESPGDRPTMAEAAAELERLLAREQQVNCSVCLSPSSRDGASWCVGGRHVYCTECVGSVVQQWAELPIDPHHLEHRGELFCPFRGDGGDDGGGGLCSGPLALALTSTATVMAMKRVMRDVGVAELQRDASSPMTTVLKVKEAIAELFVIKCPHCGSARSIDFNDCLALTCGDCGTMFCGYCLQLATDTDVNHKHVRGHRADLDRHCGSTVPHHSRCAHRDSEPLWTCEPRWRRVWYETRIRAAVEALLKRLPDDGTTRCEVRRDLDVA